MATGPLAGVRIVEMAGIGPAPFCGMLLSDLGADVVRIDRPGGPPLRDPVTSRGRRSILLDLKRAEDVETALRLIERAEALIEGFRPGVMEKLGLGPEVALARNPRLIYGRMTGWGQTGPLAQTAGHDLDYIAVAGALHAIGRAGERPVPPLNLVGDYGGGALYLALGICAGILHARATGAGQVIDCAMVDGTASLTSLFWGLRAMGLWSDARGTNLLDGAAPFYDVYECACGGFLAVAPIEPQFWAALRRGLGVADDPRFDDPLDPSRWQSIKEALAAIFRTRTRDEWCERFAGSDACVAPVLSMGEARHHPHNVARAVFVSHEGIDQPAPAPRFSGTPGAIQRRAPEPGEHTEEILASWGVTR